MIKGIKIGLGITGSFCTFDKLIPQVQKMVESEGNVIPILTNNASTLDTRFGKAKDFKNKLESITGNKIVDNIVDAEPLGPSNAIDVMVIAPCTGKNYD